MTRASHRVERAPSTAPTPRPVALTHVSENNRVRPDYSRLFKEAGAGYGRIHAKEFEPMPTMPSLLTIFPQPRDLLALAPEELAGVLIEIIPSVSQRAGFLIDNFIEPFFPLHGSGYPPNVKEDIAVATAEA